MTAEQSSARRVFWFAVKILLAAGVLWVLFTQVPPGSILDAFSSASWPPLVLAILLIPLQLFLRIGRWVVLLRASGHETSWRKAGPAVVVGHAFSVVTPAEVGDYLARARMHSGMEVSTTLALTIVDKVVHSVLILLIGIPAVVSLMMRSPAAGGLAIAGGLLLLVAAGFLRRRVLSLAFLRRIAAALRFTDGLRAIHDLPNRTLLRVAALGVAVLLTYVVQEYLLLNALADVSFVQAWQGFWAGMGVRSVLPFFFGDLGIREATHIYFFGLLGIDAVVAMSASLLMFALNVLLPTLFGLGVFLKGRSTGT